MQRYNTKSMEARSLAHRELFLALGLWMLWLNQKFYFNAANLQGCNQTLPPSSTDLYKIKEQKLTSQTYVISFHQQDVFETFREQNADTGIFTDQQSIPMKHNNRTTNHKDFENSVAWFPAVNGYDPKVLEEWDRTTHESFPKIRPEMGREGWPDPDNGNQTHSYFSPHVIGCFESHRRLLQLLSDSWNLKNGAERSNSNAPDALFVFEDDAICVPDTYQNIMELIPKLPPTWDLLFIGGKPFSVYESKPDLGLSKEELEELKKSRDEGDTKKFREKACSGVFGVSDTGPFGKKGDDLYDRNRKTFHPNQPYWKTNHITDTHSFVVNPKRIGRILKVLNDNKASENPVDQFRPVDVTLADAMKLIKEDGRGADLINAYLPAEGMYCEQRKSLSENYTKPVPWEGWHFHAGVGSFWDELYFSDCPDSYKNGLL